MMLFPNSIVLKSVTVENGAKHLMSDGLPTIYGKSKFVPKSGTIRTFK